MPLDDFFDLPPINTDEETPGTVEYAIVQWCETRLKRGIQFTTSQIGYDRIDKAIREIFSNEQMGNASYAPPQIALQRGSKTRANFLAKIAEDLTAMLTDTRYFWNYVSRNSKYDKQAYISNKSAERWYVNRMIDLRIGDVIRDYTAAGSGFAHLYYDKTLDDMMLERIDPRHYYPIDPIGYHSTQESMGGIIRQARTPEWFKEKYGKNAAPDEGGAPGGFFGWLTRVLDGPGQQGGPLSKKSDADKAIPATPTLFVNTMYLKDPRTNKTGNTVRMGKWSKDGKPMTPWSYEVKPDAPLYPFLRMIIWANGVLAYDGPSPYWHARIPVIKFTLNPWPMSWFGKAPLWDLMPLQSSLNSLLCVIDDHAAQLAQPGVVADRNVSKAELSKFNSRQPGYKIKTNMASGKGITVVNPPPLDQSLWEHVRWIQDVMMKLSGTADPSMMATLAQVPSDDTIDTLMKAMTPGVRLRSRILEGCYKELAYMFLFCNAEWDSLAKRINELGPSAVTHEDFDYDPKTFIPDDVPDGDLGDIASNEEAFDGPRPLHARAAAMLQAISCEFDPSSLLNSAAQEDLMKYAMFAKMGYVDCFTLMDKAGIQNFAPSDLNLPPDIVSRLALQQKLGIGMVANAQGRKATDSAPPSLGQSGNGPTIQTS